eukprot:557744-Rhodomonas_salina.2
MACARSVLREPLASGRPASPIPGPRDQEDGCSSRDNTEPAFRTRTMLVQSTFRSLRRRRC